MELMSMFLIHPFISCYYTLIYPRERHLWSFVGTCWRESCYRSLSCWLPPDQMLVQWWISSRVLSISVRLWAFLKWGVQENFQKFFQDEQLFRKTYKSVKTNKRRLIACSVPLLCCMVCFCLKKQFTDDDRVMRELKTTTTLCPLYWSIMARVSLSSPCWVVWVCWQREDYKISKTFVMKSLLLRLA